MSNRVRPIHLPSAAALRALQERLQPSLEAWSGQWLSDAAAAAVRDEWQLSSLQAGESGHCEFEALRSSAGTLWLRRAASDRTRFAAAVAGPALMRRSRCIDGWVAAGVGEAWQALARTLSTALLAASFESTGPASLCELPLPLYCVGSGAVQLCNAVLGLCAVVDDRVWHQLPPQRTANRQLPARTSLEQAVRGAPVQLDVLLGTVSLELTSVLDLRRGDVLLTSQRLDRDLTVLCEDRALVGARLGRSGANKCVQLTHRPSSSARGSKDDHHRQ